MYSVQSTLGKLLLGGLGACSQENFENLLFLTLNLEALLTKNYKVVKLIKVANHPIHPPLDHTLCMEQGVWWVQILKRYIVIILQSTETTT